MDTKDNVLVILIVILILGSLGYGYYKYIVLNQVTYITPAPGTKLTPQ